MSIQGIKQGMVMQRGTDQTCAVYFTSMEPLQSITCSDGITPSWERIDDQYLLTNIPCGGPYTVTINNDVFTNIYVGDVWILAGQSNMEGVGRLTTDLYQNNNNAIRAHFMTDVWGVAKHPLHELAAAKHKVHTEVLRAVAPHPIIGAGPGLTFAKRLFELSGVPQGLISCAHGGTTLEQWSPDKKELGGDESLYAAMFERFKENGANVAGMFWYQGCSEASEEAITLFNKNMIKLISSIRDDFRKEIPIVQVQISRFAYTEENTEPSQEQWSRIRENQRLLQRHIHGLDTVHTMHYRLDDLIHLDGKSQDHLGITAAESMYAMLHEDKKGCLPGIQLGSIECKQDEYLEYQSQIIVHFENVQGELTSSGRIMGFDQAADKSKPIFTSIYDAYAEGSTIVLRVELPHKELLQHWLWYGYGLNPACNVTDSHGRSIPAFGPVRIGNVD